MQDLSHLEFVKVQDMMMGAQREESNPRNKHMYVWKKMLTPLSLTQSSRLPPSTDVRLLTRRACCSEIVASREAGIRKRAQDNGCLVGSLHTKAFISTSSAAVWVKQRSRQ